jgi:hypothetical protein
LEFERILEEKGTYIAGLNPDKAEPLNVDALERVLDASWPRRNKDLEEPERYSELLEDLLQFEIRDTSKLRQLIEKHKKDALQYDIAAAAKEAAREFPPPDERALRGYVFNHVGLTRKVLQEEFGSGCIEYRKNKIRAEL